MCREFAYVVGLYPCVAPPALLPGRWIAQSEGHRNKQTEMERDYMNFLQNRPRKLMATAALSVPLLAAGSTVMFSGVASAATVSPAHGVSAKCGCKGGTPTPSVSPTQPTTPPTHCGCTKPPTTPPTTPPPTVPTTAPPTPSVSASTAPPAPAASVTPVAT